MSGFHLRTRIIDYLYIGAAFNITGHRILTYNSFHNASLSNLDGFTLLCHNLPCTGSERSSLCNSYDITAGKAHCSSTRPNKSCLRQAVQPFFTAWLDSYNTNPPMMVRILYPSEEFHLTWCRILELISQARCSAGKLLCYCSTQ
jgi:hypothetical protein